MKFFAKMSSWFE